MENIFEKKVVKLERFMIIWKESFEVEKLKIELATMTSIDRLKVKLETIVLVGKHTLDPYFKTFGRYLSNYI